MPEEKQETSRFRVGYALPQRKLESFMVPPFITYATQQGIDFLPIDVSKPLTQQGPFHCIIHKLYGHQWNQNLHDFAGKHPTATVVDHPSAIQRLHNRISMLEPITQLNIPNLTIPNQLLVQDHPTLTSLRTLNDLGFTFPVIAKPLLADGSTDAHNMLLVFNREGLTGLDPPVVLQQFVNHGGVIFKVYVAGEYVKCVKRSSLPDIPAETTGLECGGAMSFSQISGPVMAGEDGVSGEEVKTPAPEFVGEVAKGLREALGLHLFNFDMIRGEKGEGYLVVDINYFPGYEKLPNYENVMVDFLLKIKKAHEEKERKKMAEEEEEKSAVVEELTNHRSL